MTKQIQHRLQIISVFLMIFYIWIAYQIPYTHDDLYWGISDGIDYLFNAKLNSRYFGNAIVTILTRSELLKTLVMGITFWLIPLLMTKIVTYKNKDRTLIIYLVCNIFPVILHWNVFRQTYSWVSGFSNYVVSTLFLIIHFLIVQELFVESSTRNENISWYKLITIFIFSVLIQLLLENITVVMMLISVGTLLISIKRNINKSKYISILAGNILGAIIMFSSPMYKTLAIERSSLGGIREIVVAKDSVISSISNIFYNISNTLIPFMIVMLFLFYIIITVLLMYIIINKHKSNKEQISRTAVILLAMFPLTLLILLIGAYSNYAISSITYIIYNIFVLYTLIVYINDEITKKQCVILYAAHIIVMSPLTIIGLGNTSIHRLFITPGMLLMLVIGLIISDESTKLSIKAYKIISRIVTVAIIFSACHFGYVYYSIGKTTREFHKQIEYTIENDLNSLSFPTSKYFDKYLYMVYPSEARYEYFRTFYSLDESVELITNRNTEKNN